ncbi:MAG: hypothetical protein K0U52_05455, partial [Gammaproteobacteria bacterium]|nr:hypothetical protein [Gammaproteobacteria bacterium]
ETLDYLNITTSLGQHQRIGLQYSMSYAFIQKHSRPYNDIHVPVRKWPNFADMDKEDLSVDDILSAFGLPWDWDAVSGLDRMTIDFLYEYKHLPLNWIKLSGSDCITSCFIYANVDLEWDWNRLFLRGFVDKHFVMANKEKCWDWCDHNFVRKFSLKFIQDNPCEYWDGRAICCVRSLTPEYVLENTNIKWEFGDLFKEGMQFPSGKLPDHIKVDLPVAIDLGVPFTMLCDNVSSDWDWTYFTRASIVTKERFLSRLSFPWDLKWVFERWSFSNSELLEIFEKSGIKEKRLDVQVLIKAVGFSVIVDSPDLDWDWSCVFKCMCESEKASLILKLPDKPWDWVDIQEHFVGNGKVDFILDHPDLAWDWSVMWPNVSIDEVVKLKHKNWCWKSITEDFSLGVVDLLRACDKGLPLDWKILSRKFDVNPDVIRKHIDRDWDWVYLSGCTSIPIEFVTEFVGKGWDWSVVSGHPYLWPEDVLKFPLCPWDWGVFSCRSDWPFSFVEGMVSKAWDWGEVVKCYDLDMRFITRLKQDTTKVPDFSDVDMRYSSRPRFSKGGLLDSIDLGDVFWEKLHHNSVFQPCLLKMFPGKSWDWKDLSGTVNFGFVVSNFDLPWDLEVLVGHPKFNMQIVIENKQKSWNWDLLSSVGNMKYVKKYPDLPWNYNLLSAVSSLDLHVVHENESKPWDWDTMMSSIGDSAGTKVDFVCKYKNKSAEFEWMRKKLRL